ncbi:EGF-like domain protein, partial [Cooperia oncophora]
MPFQLCTRDDCNKQGSCMGLKAAPICMCDFGYFGPKCEHSLISQGLCDSATGCSGNGLCIAQGVIQMHRALNWYITVQEPGKASRVHASLATKEKTVRIKLAGPTQFCLQWRVLARQKTAVTKGYVWVQKISHSVCAISAELERNASIPSILY